jgi:ribose transport system ATP-binding protein
VLVLHEIDKRYGATHAVINVTLEIPRGKILGLVGENGAGKSTLIKVVSGVVKADHGWVTLDGERVAYRTPRDALARGIGSVFQELALVNSLTVEENLFLPYVPTAWHKGVDRRRLRRECLETLERFDLRIRPSARVEDLQLGQRQMLEIARALIRNPQVLLLDEPTSALGAGEVEWLLHAVRTARADGKAILFTSHRWDEIVEFCDLVAVMRNGQLVYVCATPELDKDHAVRLMTGRSIQAAVPAKAVPGRDVSLRADHLSSRLLRDVSLQVRTGEIVGVGGLVGQGQRALLEALFGVHRLTHGDVYLGGRRIGDLRPDRAIRLGIAYVPQDRGNEGLLLHKSIAFNLTLCILKTVTTVLGIIRLRTEARVVQQSIDRLAVQTRGRNDVIVTLSGGNQQKVLLEKWFRINPRVLLLNDVTRGVDIATKSQIYHLITDAASWGIAVLMYSTDTTELVHLAHRVLVLQEGAVGAELAGAELTSESVVRASITRRSV